MLIAAIPHAYAFMAEDRLTAAGHLYHRLLYGWGYKLAAIDVPPEAVPLLTDLLVPDPDTICGINIFGRSPPIGTRNPTPPLHRLQRRPLPDLTADDINAIRCDYLLDHQRPITVQYQYSIAPETFREIVQFQVWPRLTPPIAQPMTIPVSA